jgi:hypothetical protein
VFVFAPAVFGGLHDLTAGYEAAFILAAMARVGAFRRRFNVLC